MITNLARAWGAHILEPIARFFGAIGLTPKSLTWLGLGLTVAVSLVLAAGSMPLAGLLLIVTLGFDALDGTLARLTAPPAASELSWIPPWIAGRRLSCTAP